MPDESDVLPASRIVRWIAVGGLIAFALALYFRDGRLLPPLTGARPASPVHPLHQSSPSQRAH